MCPENNYTHTHTHSKLYYQNYTKTDCCGCFPSFRVHFLYILSLYLRTGCAARHRAATIYVLVPFHFNFIIFDHAFAAALASFIEIFSSWCGFFFVFMCVVICLWAITQGARRPQRSLRSRSRRWPGRFHYR